MPYPPDIHMRSRPQRGFTRWDLLAVLAGISILLGWLGCTTFGERARTVQCGWNLSRMGRLTQSFANEHGGHLPPAVIEEPQLAWDMQIAVYLTDKDLKHGLDPLFLCPSDTLDRSRPRSYAMPVHDMKSENWPPGQANQTGVGLDWTSSNVRRLLGAPAVNSVKTNTDLLALVPLSGIPTPADTLLLTEQIRPNNLLKRNNGATIAASREQLDAFPGDKARFHLGRLNYLMIDGHVERLTPFESDALESSVWTIKRPGG